VDDRPRVGAGGSFAGFEHEEEGVESGLESGDGLVENTRVRSGGLREVVELARIFLWGCEYEVGRG
jgi:hypothetical protein